MKKVWSDLEMRNLRKVLQSTLVDNKTDELSEIIRLARRVTMN